MTRLKRPMLALLLALLPAVGADAWIRSPATQFAALPAGATNPEGIATDAAGNLYVTTFAVGGTSSGVGQIFVFSPSGQLLRQMDVAGSSTWCFQRSRSVPRWRRSLRA